MFDVQIVFVGVTLFCQPKQLIDPLKHDFATLSSDIIFTTASDRELKSSGFYGRGPSNYVSAIDEPSN